MDLSNEEACSGKRSAAFDGRTMREVNLDLHRWSSFLFRGLLWRGKLSFVNFAFPGSKQYYESSTISETRLEGKGLSTVDRVTIIFEDTQECLEVHMFFTGTAPELYFKLKLRWQSKQYRKKTYDAPSSSPIFGKHAGLFRVRRESMEAKRFRKLMVKRQMWKCYELLVW